MATLLDLLRVQVSTGGGEAVPKVSNDFAKDQDADEMTRALDGLEHTRHIDGAAAGFSAAGARIRRAGQTKTKVNSPRRTASASLARRTLFERLFDTTHPVRLKRLAAEQCGILDGALRRPRKMISCRCGLSHSAVRAALRTKTPRLAQPLNVSVRLWMR